MRLILVIALLAPLGAASAATAAPAVPRPVQLQVKSILIQIGAPDLAVVPARLPAHFAFNGYSMTGTPPVFNVLFADQRFLKTSKQVRQHTISFDASYFKGSVRSCASKARKTLKARGNTLYSNGTTVWRCLRSARGRVVKESAGGHAPETALAAIVVSTSTIR